MKKCILSTINHNKYVSDINTCKHSEYNKKDFTVYCKNCINCKYVTEECNQAMCCPTYQEIFYPAEQ